jgi:hypothetical protein
MHNCSNPYLMLIVVMYAQKFFTLHNFPQKVGDGLWSKVQITHGLGKYA